MLAYCFSSLSLSRPVLLQEAATSPSMQVESQQAQAAVPGASRAASTTRLQFRFADATSRTHMFEVGETLQAAAEWLATECTAPSQPPSASESSSKPATPEGTSRPHAGGASGTTSGHVSRINGGENAL